MPHGQKPKAKQKLYCNKFNEGFKNGPHLKKIFKKIKQFENDKLHLHKDGEEVHGCQRLEMVVRGSGGKREMSVWICEFCK